MTESTLSVRPLGAGAAELVHHFGPALRDVRVERGVEVMAGDILAALRNASGGVASTELLLVTLTDLSEMLEDMLAAGAYARTRGEESVPAEIVDRLLANENPVRVWREHRGLSLAELADKGEISKSYLSQLETGERTGTTETMKKLASALAVDIDDLV